MFPDRRGRGGLRARAPPPYCPLPPVPATPEPHPVIDFHNHLVPGVDDGAATLDEARAALRDMHAQGVRTVVTTPHLAGTLTLRGPELAGYLARVDEAWLALRQAAEEEFPGLRLE